LMTRSTKSELILKIQRNCLVQCEKRPEAAVLRLIQLIGEHLRFINLFILNLATKL
jgi:hypothetical protein